MKDWLKKAIEVNEEFNNSKYGKLSDGKIRQLDGASDGAKIRGQKSVEEKLGIHAATKEQRSEWAKNSGFSAMSPEERSSIGKTYGKKNLLKEIVCEKCGNTVNKGNYHQFHGEKCREADKIRLINALPDLFTKAMIKEVANRIEIKDWEKLNITHHTCPYTEIHIKVERPNQYNPSWYKKLI